jgi:apolipoprotein N-acyltransferase
MGGGGYARAGGIGAALLLPFGSLLVLGRRRQFIGTRMLGVVVLLLASCGLIVGCGSSGAPGTPAGTTNVTVAATSGGITQTAVVAVTVQ